MENQEIGITTIHYKENGDFESGSFKPTLIKNVDIKQLDFMEKINCDTEEDKIKSQATNIFAAWVEQVNQIQLIDLSKFKIEAKVVGKCLRYENNNIKRITLQFTLVKI